jgi:hypothetical protein
VWGHLCIARARASVLGLALPSVETFVWPCAYYTIFIRFVYKRHSVISEEIIPHTSCRYKDGALHVRDCCVASAFLWHTALIPLTVEAFIAIGCDLSSYS